ncbi:MAG: LacI family DNA-binding transcriptional regulator [Saprospiraceae bacterium]
MSRTNIKEIAKALNLSISTVSRALRDSYEISSKTKAKVLEYAEKVNYKPDPIAQSLKDKNSHNICVIVPEMANMFFSQVIDGIDRAAYEKGYNVFVFQTYESIEREKLGIEFGLERRVCGFIVSVSGATSVCEKITHETKHNF